MNRIAIIIILCSIIMASAFGETTGRINPEIARMNAQHEELLNFAIGQGEWGGFEQGGDESKIIQGSLRFITEIVTEYVAGTIANCIAACSKCKADKNNDGACMKCRECEQYPWFANLRNDPAGIGDDHAIELPKLDVRIEGLMKSGPLAPSAARGE